MHEDGPIKFLTRAPLLQWMGIRTYAIYLAHMPALGGAKYFFEVTGLNPHGLTRPLALLLAFGFAFLSWRLLEAPLIRLGHRRKYGRGSKPVVLTLDASQASV